MVLSGQESQLSGSDFGVSCEVVITMSPKAVGSWRYNWAGLSAFKLTHRAISRRYQFLTSCWPKASVSHHVGLCTGLLATWQLVSPKVSDSKESKQPVKMTGAVYFIT